LWKKTVQWTVFADVATSVSEAIGAAAPRQIPLISTKMKRSIVFLQCFFLFYTNYWGESNKEGANRRFVEKNSPVDCFCRRGNER